MIYLVDYSKKSKIEIWMELKVRKKLHEEID